MTMDQALRLIAGVLISLSVALGYFVTPYAYLFTLFVGLNLAQSALTGWCPMMWLLKQVGMKPQLAAEV